MSQYIRIYQKFVRIVLGRFSSVRFYYILDVLGQVLRGFGDYTYTPLWNHYINTLEQTSMRGNGYQMIYKIHSPCNTSANTSTNVLSRAVCTFYHNCTGFVHRVDRACEKHHKRGFHACSQNTRTNVLPQPTYAHQRRRYRVVESLSQTLFYGFWQNMGDF